MFSSSQQTNYMYFHLEIKFKTITRVADPEGISRGVPEKRGSSLTLVFAHFCLEQTLITVACPSASLRPELDFFNALRSVFFIIEITR